MTSVNMDLELNEAIQEPMPEEPPKPIEFQSKKLTWPELRAVVSELRRQLSSLSTMVPTDFTFRTLQDGRTRIYFLSSPHHGWETTLLFADILNTNQPAGLRLQWQYVLESNFPCISSGKSSREEQLMWERKRLATWGINSYEIHEDSGKIVFPTASSLFQCVDSGYTNGQLFPTKLRMTSMGAKLNPQICPRNAELVAYICNHDIWVTHTVSGSNVRITYAHKGGRNLADDPLSAGVPSYVMQEEFSRYQGFWWQPKCVGDVYRILYEEVDDSDVKLYCFPSSHSDTGDVEEFRFPRAGSANSKSYLKLVEFKLNEHLQIVDICLLDLQFSLNGMFPWMEYVVRIGWTPDAEFVWVQLLDRLQKHLEIVLLSLNNFASDLPYFNHSSDLNNLSGNPTVQVIYAQDSQYWINVHDLLYFLPSDDPNEIKFIWANEDTGYRHLYVITSHISQLVYGLPESSEVSSCTFLTPKIVSKVQLTSGDWEVLSQNLWVNFDRQLIYFMGLKETPLEKHLYIVSLKRPGEVRLLTRPGYSYNVEFNRDCSLLVTVYSNIRKPPACQVFRVEQIGWAVEEVSLSPLGYLVHSPGSICETYLPDLYTHEIQSGHLIYAMVFKPHNFKPDQKYPTILNVYGGPEVQLVSNSFKGMRHLRMHMLAARGYCVVAIDSRGSLHRGIQFEGYIKGKMGTVELKDQVEVLRWLAESLGYIDLQRVAIHGWSYGGYLSLMGLIHHPDVFKVAIAGAPVTNWNFYDTGYTERYMDLPLHNADGYEDGSVLKYVHKFPDEENRLLIIHGLIDENVHFYHTSQLIKYMVNAGKPYQLQIYPHERHSLRHLDSSKHYETTFLSFLQNHL
ncbi:dipeptidyl peptidase 9 [Dendroctonus ponderosae]|uniref:Dipeptidyl peptidase 9 n=1 Tax=Dendroctonus ponderosae TaxID=77166 RepID=A0AAR5PC02_DENPD|nr:dipeptidyl peptidase 9 [Dendroctonus ponderosae]XP_048517978.1 dipeptidyl peptidase 9 [Dendroctonus ponderosae]